MSASARSPAVAGRFYASDPGELRAEVRGYLEAAGSVSLDGPLVGVIVPHAGIMYSGPVAAYSYRALQSQEWDAVALVGGSHHYPLTGAHVYARGAWASPLGDFPIAEDLAAELVASDDRIVDDPEPHEPEHALEVQLPFLAETLGHVPIIPVLVSPSAPAACTALGTSLGKLARDRKLAIVASTDLSHYHPYTDAKARDHAAIDAICAWDPLALVHGAADQSVEVCGGGAVAAAEVAAAGRGATHAALLKYATSGDVPLGPKDRVVGYAAIALLGAREAQSVAPLTEREQRQLVDLARSTLQAFVLGRPLPALPNDAPRLAMRQGVFVTLRLNGTDLRGCLGRTETPPPLAEGVRRFTEAAASRDPRFPPVGPEELDHMDIEISVLAPAEPVADPAEVCVGRDGLVIVRGNSTGLLLPQVAPGQGWDRSQLLEGVSRKAGLPADAWRWDGTDLYRFTAQVFGEERETG